MEGNGDERSYKQTQEEDDRLLILILVASFIIISMIIIIGSTACILLCFEESIEEKEEELQEIMAKLTEKKKKGQKRSSESGQSVKMNYVMKPPDTVHHTPQHQETVNRRKVETNFDNDSRLSVSVMQENNSRHNNNSPIRSPPPGGHQSLHKPSHNGFKSEGCLLEQLRVSENWKHLMAVEQGGQVKLNLREQLSAQL